MNAQVSGLNQDAGVGYRAKHIHGRIDEVVITGEGQGFCNNAKNIIWGSIYPLNMMRMVMESAILNMNMITLKKSE